MPYLIALAVLVVASIGFTVLQSTHVTTDTVTNNTTQEDVLIMNPDTVIAISSDTQVEPEPTEPPIKELETNNTLSTQPATKPDVIPEPTPVVTTPVVSKPVTPPPTPAVAYDYMNGSYTSHVTYRTPERDTYTMDVTLTIKNDIVTASNIIYGNGAERDSYARRFNNSYESVVVGKDIDTVSLSRVGGASLTTRAFTEAVTKIKTEAAA